MRVYFEVNGICRARDAGVSGADLRHGLLARGMEPVVGIHTLYEIGRGLGSLRGAGPSAASGAIVRDLRPMYSQPVDRLIAQELELLRTGVPVAAFLERGDLANAEAEARRFAIGIRSPEARAFIPGRESDIATNFAPSCNEVIESAAAVQESSSQDLRLPTFDHAISYFQPRLDEFVGKLVPGATRAEVRALVASPGSCPVIHAAVNANIYINFVCTTERRAPALDKLDDNRHAIEAAYCDAIVTNDKQLRFNAPLITPGLRVLAWDDVKP